jgi:hypothetical protein
LQINTTTKGSEGNKVEKTGRKNLSFMASSKCNKVHWQIKNGPDKNSRTPQLKAQ